MIERVRYTRQNIITNTFYQLPKFLFDEEFSDLSNDARVLYALLRNRHEISIVNGWYDEKNEVYQYFKREDMQAMLQVSENTITKAMKVLKDFGLLEEQRQGCNKPNRIYLLAAIGTLHGIGESAENADKQRNLKIYGSESAEFTAPEPQNLRFHNNHNKEIHNKYIDNPVMSCQSESNGQDEDRTDDTARKIESYTALIKDNISYNDLAVTRSYDMRLIDEFIAIIIDTVMSEGRTVRIGGEDKPRALVAGQLMKLTYGDIEHAIDQFKSVTERISKKKQYILTMLYNCKMELDSHYTNAVISDKWQ